MIRFNLAQPGQAASVAPRLAAIVAVLGIGGLGLCVIHWRLASERVVLEQGIASAAAALAESAAAESEMAKLTQALEERRASRHERSMEAEPLRQATCELAQLIELLPAGISLEEIAHSGSRWSISGLGHSPSVVMEMVGRLVQRGFAAGALQLSERPGRNTTLTSFHLEVG